MDVRKLPVGRGLQWFRQAADLGVRNPRAIFGAGLLFILTLYAVVLLMMLPAVGMMRAGASTDFRALLGWLAPLFLVVLLLMPVLFGGLMHVIREAEGGRPVRARDLYAPLRQGAARRLALLGLLQLVFGLVGAIVAVALAGADYWQQYLAAVQGALNGVAPVMPEPAHPGLLLVFQLLFNYFTYAVMLFSIPLMLFSGRPLREAIVLSLRAALANAGPNLLAAGLFLGAVIVAALLTTLLATLASLVGGLILAPLGTLLELLVLLVFGVVVIVVLTGVAYFAWRDIFEGDRVQPAPFAGIEA
ncbi:MAG TPA: hypothetical protein VHL61_08375 [Luteimonas sp.]|jgi:hypothetical protein|nr:hypothetical protein [Luteimonas sp.]